MARSSAARFAGELARAARPRKAWITVEAALGVRQLHRIDVDRDDFVMRRKLRGRAACGGNTEDTAPWPKGIELDGRVLVHASEQHVARPDSFDEAARVKLQIQSDHPAISE